MVRECGYSAPTTGLIGISRDLRKLGVDAQLIIRMVLSLHRFSYNGLDPNLVDYRNLNEVKEDLVEVLKWISNVKDLFRDNLG